MNKKDYLEVSEGATAIVSCANCPLSYKQALDSAYLVVKDTPLCLEREKGHVCPGFHKVIYTEGYILVDCRINGHSSFHMI